MDNPKQPLPAIPTGYVFADTDEIPELPSGYKLADQKKRQVSNAGGKTSNNGLGVFRPQPNTAKPSVLNEKGSAVYDKQVKDDVVASERLSKDLQKAQGAYGNAQGTEASKSMQQAQEVSSAARLAGSIKEDKDRSGNRFGYIYNQMLKGIGSAVTGVADAAIVLAEMLPTGDTEIESGALLKDYRENGAPIVREYLKDGIGADVDKGREKKFDDEFITSALGGLAYSAPAMVTPYGIGLFSQAYDTGLESINSSEEGQKLSEGQKTLYAGLIGGVVGLLEKTGLERIFGKSSVSQRAIDGLVVKAVDAAKRDGIKLTSDYFDKFIGREINSLSAKLLRTGKNVGEASLIEGVTGGLQELATIGSERITNVLTDKDVFDKQSLGEMTGRVLKASAAEALGGGILGGVKSFQNSSTKSELVNRITSVKSFEDNRNLLVDIEQAATELGLNEAEIEDITNSLDQYQKIIERLPADLPAEAKAKIIPLVEEREDLIESMKGEVAKLDKIDSAFQPQQAAKIEALNERVKAINGEISKGANIISESEVVSTVTELAGMGIAPEIKTTDQVIQESQNKIQWIEKALADKDVPDSSKETLTNQLQSAKAVLDDLTHPDLSTTNASPSTINTSTDEEISNPQIGVSDSATQEVDQVPQPLTNSDDILDKAESDLQVLKSVKNKTVKYEASVKRLDDALAAGSISEEEHLDFTTRFNDVIKDFKPKKQTISIEESVEEQALLSNPDMEIGEQFDIEDEIIVPEEKKSYHESEKSKAVFDIKAQWQKLGVVGIADDPIQKDQDLAKLFEAITRYAYHGIMDGSIKLKGRISDKIDEIIRTLGLINVTDQQYEQIGDTVRVQAEKARADVKKMSPPVKTVIKKFVEVKSDFKEKDVISRLTQLKRRLADEMRGFRKGVKDGKNSQKDIQQAKDDIINGLRTEIKLQIKDARDNGLISGKVSSTTFTNAINRVNNAKTPLQLLSAIDYMSRVISDIDYDAKLNTANRLRDTVKNLAKRKGLPANISESMRNIARAVPSELDDIKEYNKLLSDVVANINGTSISGINTSLLNDVADYIAEQKQKQLKARYELLIGDQDGFGYESKTLSEMKADIDELLAEDYKQKDDRRDADEAISELLREDLLDADLSGYAHKQEIEAIESLKTVELSGLTDKELRLYNIAVNNLIINGKLNGTSVIIAVARRQKYFSNKALIADIKSTTRAVSKWADNIRADWANIPTQLKAFSNSDRGLAKYYVVTGLSDIKNGYTRVSNRLEQIEKGIEAIIKKSKSLRNEPIKQIEIAVYADLAQYPQGSTQEEIQDEFTGRRDAIALTIERLKEKSSTDKNFQKEHANFIKLLEQVYVNVKDAKSISDIKLDAEQIVLYDYMRKYFDSIQEDTKLNAEIANNINFSPIINYFPRNYTRIDKYFGSAAKEELKTKIIGSGIYFGNPDIQKELSGTKNERTIKKDQLPKDRVINLDLVPNFLNTTRNILYDIETQQARIYTQELITSKEDMQALTADDSIVEITNRVAKQLVTNHKIGLLPVEAKGILKAFGEFWRGSANRYALGGISQWMKQSLSALTTTAGVLGVDSGYLAQSIQTLIINNAAANQLMSGFSISRRAANKSALTHTNVKESDVSKLNRSLDKFFVRAFDNWNDLADKVSLQPLVFGDAVSAKASWCAFYSQYLVKEGIVKSISEFDIVKESESPNAEAAEYAEQMTNTTLNINDRTMAPELKPMWGIMPFLSFSINSKLNLGIDLARVSRKDISMNERVRAARMVVGHVAASAVLNAVGWAVRDAMISDTFDIVTYLIGDDEDEKKQKELIKYADELEMEMYNRNAANTFGYIAKDVVIGGILAPVTDPLINPMVDKTIAWYKGEDYKEQYVRPADALTMIGLYGIPAKSIVNLAEKSFNLMLPDDQFIEERFGITAADGTQVYIPVTDRNEERREWAKKAIAVSVALNAAQVLTSMSAQEVSAISRRLPSLIKKLEDKRFGAKRKFDLEAEEKALAEITREGVTYILDKKQLEFRKKAKKEWLNDWYSTIKDADTDDKASEQTARERSNKYSAEQVVYEYGFEGLKKKE